jgi:hypothetical protein
MVQDDPWTVEKHTLSTRLPSIAQDVVLKLSQAESVGRDNGIPHGGLRHLFQDLIANISNLAKKKIFRTYTRRCSSESL